MRVLTVILALLLAAPLHAAEFKLATWNIAWLTLRAAGDPLLPERLAPRQPGDIARLADYARRLEADIVALQEVEGAEAAQRVFDPRAYAFFFARENDVQRTGFAIRRTLATTQNEDLAALDLAPGARFSQRRGTDVTVTLNGRPLRLLSVHLNAGCREGPMDGARNRECDGLARQSEVLARWIAERRREGVAFAVLGDFNRRMDHPRDEMTAMLGAAAQLTRANEGASNPCWADARGARPFIDHILLGGAAREWMQRGSLRVMVYAERDPAYRDRLSDHCPVSVRLRVP